MSERPRAAEAMLTTLQDLPPNALTWCGGWTVHHVGAHIAGNYLEALRHIEAYAEGSPLTSTRSFEEREPPLRALPEERLLATVEQAEERMRRAAEAVVADDPDAELTWTGRPFRVADFLSHMRNECALHRWDLVGDDDTSVALLSDPALLKHSVTAVGAGPLCARGLRAVDESGPFSARMRTEGQPDLLVEVAGGEPALSLTDPSGEATVAGDQAARLLMLWGRVPSPPMRLRRVGPQDDSDRLQALFAGY
ncbi:maleylpyruvate isomerase N-terminal domain-containing protein [Actinomadura napierensis]|uniref:Mycothiol-dependent maleylpyruvate isomerase metal-binding domain-containing protein n=1 Tax=Actinomadura napierensis TaxID=267854 RepID=A0ABN2ZGE6_9ACTN